MPFTVLSDTNVREVLYSLNKKDVQCIQHALAEALHNYSTANTPEDSGCCASNQPSRVSVKGKNGLTTLFMPATSDDGLGVKVVTLAAPKANEEKNHGVATPSSSEAITTPKGSLTLLSPHGIPLAILNAHTLTAFRTALASTLLLNGRQKVHTLCVFGAGAQAYWHIYLSLLLRGSEIRNLHIVNRNSARAQDMLTSLASATRTPNAEVRAAFNWGGSRLLGAVKAGILSPHNDAYARVLKVAVREADVLFCCTPSTTPLFPGPYLTEEEPGMGKGRYIAAVGSYQPHMQEVPGEVVRRAVSGEGEDKQVSEGGVVVVDTIEGALKEAGELIRAGIDRDGVVGLGEVIMLQRDGEEGSHSAARARCFEKLIRKGQGSEDESGVMDWLERGNVIYKSVGIGLMDIVVGLEIVRLAEERGIGTTVQDF